MPLPRRGNCGQTQNVPQENHGQTMLKMSSISDLKRPTAGPQKYWTVEMMQRTANENAACLRRICKRSNQPKIERLVNNVARLIRRRWGRCWRISNTQTDVTRWWHEAFWPRDSTINFIGHFRVLLYRCFKTSLSAKPFILRDFKPWRTRYKSVNYGISNYWSP